jgi:hypothetical protein
MVKSFSQLYFYGIAKSQKKEKIREAAQTQPAVPGRVPAADTLVAEGEMY